MLLLISQYMQEVLVLLMSVIASIGIYHNCYWSKDNLSAWQHWSLVSEVRSVEAMIWLDIVCTMISQRASTTLMKPFCQIQVLTGADTCHVHCTDAHADSHMSAHKTFRDEADQGNTRSASKHEQETTLCILMLKGFMKSPWCAQEWIKHSISWAYFNRFVQIRERYGAKIVLPFRCVNSSSLE